MSNFERVIINGIALRCGHCGNRVFTPRRQRLNSESVSSFNFDAPVESADGFVCSQCGQLQWFLFKEGAAPERMSSEVDEDYGPDAVEPVDEPLPSPGTAGAEEDPGDSPPAVGSDAPSDPDIAELDVNYDVECVRCGHNIPAGQSICTQCGWTYMA